VWEHRERLTAYARALLALTAHRYGDTERAAILVRNLEDGVQRDRAVDDEAESMATAHWGSSQRFWWRWYEGPVETTAFVLRALVTIDPKHALVEPTMNWLVKNRRGAQWNNTRDTAVSLLALNDYLERSGELRGDVSYDLTVNGHVVATKKLSAADVLRAPSRFSVDAAALKDTTQEIRIRRTSGNAPLYFAAEARFVSLEEPVKAAGNEIYVRRDYYRLKPRLTLLKGVLFDKVLLRDGESVISGERLEVVVTVDAKNRPASKRWPCKAASPSGPPRPRPTPPPTSTRNCATAKWPCSSTTFSKVSGRCVTRSAPRPRARSTPCRSWGRRCTCRR
jgi:hypothetical protein